ncbi:uncharacterized protein frmpd1b [Chanos chanos]|uniref:Uncharacterized protein frmpd1b n=1 Tax=Chanos chanos TaxID=29144 RepID=A0A6J2UR85_CHACN|nr:uncharacterized protein LOC115805213 [Chanos chanos]
MEERERSRSRSPRRTSRVEQVVGRWLRRSRDSLSRERILGDGKADRSGGTGSQNFPVKVTVEVIRDSVLDSHGFSLSTQLPLLVREVTPGGPADGRLFPGDQILKVNNKAIEDLPPEHVAEIIRECMDSVTMTILRQMSNPKSSFMTAEKRARLRRNPVKVRFAEEVVVNGHTQGNSLLFLPNVLKVYLENGQTKAFKFDSNTTVKDIVLTLKDKLSIRSIEHFALVLEQQYSITKLLLLHEDEFIQQVVQKKDSHDYRCLFRVCFIPRDPLDLMQDDPMAFEYLFQQSVGDVLQERFAVEMKCNTALRLAALHMHERLASCGQTQRASLKSISKEFGLDSFISPTLLRNMKEKDLRKALGHHLKKIQSLLEPHQKVISVSQARLAYLTQMAELISYSGRSYNATMLLQDRESLVSLLVGARFGLSQMLNHKLNMISTIIDFHYITRVELLSESDRVSMLKIYLRDIQPLALLMDSVAAKDLACLLAGYCRLLVDPNINVFRWGPRPKMRRIPIEEVYGSHYGSDSEDSSDEDYPMEGIVDKQLSEDTLSTQTSDGRGEDEEEGMSKRLKREPRAETVKVIVTHAEEEEEDVEMVGGGTVNKGCEEEEEVGGAGGDSVLETGWYTDPRVNSSFSSLSSNSLNALEENNRASSREPVLMDTLLEETVKPNSATELPRLDVHHPYLLEVPEQLEHCKDITLHTRPTDLDCDKDSGLCYAELSQMSDYLPSPPEASDDALSDGGEEDGSDRLIMDLSADMEAVLASCNSNSMPSQGPGANALLGRICSHSSCRQKNHHFDQNQRELETPQDPVTELDTLPSFPLRRAEPSQVLQSLISTKGSDSESEEEFFDAQDRLTPPITGQDPRVNHSDVIDEVCTLSVSDIKISVEETAALEPRKNEVDGVEKDNSSLLNANSLIHGPSFSTNLSPDLSTVDHEQAGMPELPPALPNKPSKPEPRPLLDLHVSEQKNWHAPSQCNGDIPNHLSSELLEMEPDTMEFKPVTSVGPPLSSPLITAVRQASSQPRTTEAQTLNNRSKQENGFSDHTPANPCGVSTPLQIDTSKARGHGKIETEKNMTEKEQGSLKEQSLSCQEPKRELGNFTSSSAKSSVVSAVSSSLLSTPQPALILKVEPTPKTEGKKDSPPNGLSLHPWSQRNGSTPSHALNKGVSLSHDNLLNEKDSVVVKVTSASTTTTPSPSPAPSPSVAFREPISGDPRDPGGTGSGFTSRTSSSGRLSTTALRGRLQDLPWYLTRSQEILGTVALISGYGPTDCKTAKVTDDQRESTKVSPKATSVPILYSGKEEDAEVVIVKLKDGPEESTSLVKEANGEIKTHSDLKENRFQNSSELYKHLGSCKSDQPQSHRDTLKDTNLEAPSPPSTAAQSHREACGCHTVYANCFSGDAEDAGGFDDEITVYEFSRRTQVNKPPQISPAPSTSSLSASTPNVLSLLRDSPRPLSCSSELSPLLTPPRPLEPRPLELGPLDDPLRSLQGRKYGTGQKGSGLKGGYASLRQDIDELLMVLKNGAPTINPPVHQGNCENNRESNGNSLSETERCLLQTEARRLASGCQRATRVGWAPEDALVSLGNSFGALVHLASACLRISCTSCGGFHGDTDAMEALAKLQEIVGLYKEFVAAVETTREGEGVRLLAKQCTVLISSVFSLTQLFRTRTPDVDNANLALVF